MDAGPLNRKITLQRFSVQRDRMNSAVETFTDIARVSANYKPVSDGEKLRGGERIADLSARFIIRYSSLVADLKPKDRALFEGRTFEIAGVKEVQSKSGRREGLELTAVARTDG